MVTRQIGIVSAGGQILLTERLTHGMGSPQCDLIGAASTVLLTLQTAIDTTTGASQPLGTRGAAAADRVAAGTLSPRDDA